MTAPSWSSVPVPRATVDIVRAATSQLVEQIIRAVRAESPAYAEVLGGPEGVGIRLGVEQAIKTFLDAIERGQRPAGDTAEMWRALGEAEFQAGRSLDDLRAAFRTGTRAAWRGAAELAARAGVDAPMVIALAEAIFVYSDELAGDVVEAYLRMQSDEAGELERRRRRLASLLLDPDGHDAEAIEHAAQLARWNVPRAVAVLALDTDTPGAVARRLDGDALIGADGAGAWLILADPEGPGRPAALRHALGDIPAALGPTVAPRAAHRSLRLARLTLELVKRGALPSAHPTRTSDHLATVILLQDEELSGALVSNRLAPLQALAPAERDRLLDTLAAWLAHQRHAPSVAAELHVHPQTVRYRIAKLRELLGGALEEPNARLELELAVRARRALNRPT